MLSEFGFTQPFEGVRVPNEIYIVTDDPDRTSKYVVTNYCSLLIRVSADYFMSYLSELLLSINEDGIPLAGAFAWGMLASSSFVSVSHRVLAMVDNSEWTSGESARYALTTLRLLVVLIPHA